MVSAKRPREASDPYSGDINPCLSARLSAIDTSGMDAPRRLTLKRRIRAAKNKESAQRSRKRKRARLGYLEEFTKEQSMRIEVALRRVAELEEENSALRAGCAPRGVIMARRSCKAGGERVSVLTSLLSGHGTNSFSAAHSAAAHPAPDATTTPGASAAAVRTHRPCNLVLSSSASSVESSAGPSGRSDLADISEDLSGLLGDFDLGDLSLPGSGSPSSLSSESDAESLLGCATELDFDDVLALISDEGSDCDLDALLL